MRCLGIDYGSRRWGLAYGDSLGVATPLPALCQSSVAARWQTLLETIRQRRIQLLVVGYPYNMDGTVGFKAREVDEFIQSLVKTGGLPVQRVDERLTSYTAGSHLPKRRNDARRRSGALDSMAATIILQDWLDQQLPDGKSTLSGSGSTMAEKPDSP